MKNFVRILDGVFLALMACGCMFLTEKSLLIVDMNRENIDGFDVREFYVKIVSQLKSMGL